MQVYTDANGIQRLTQGSISIDADTGLPVLTVIWDVEADGPIPNLAEVGGYSRVNDELVYSQQDYDDNEDLKVTVAEAEAAAIVSAKRTAAIAAIADGEASRDDVIAAIRAILLLTIDEVNILRQGQMYLRTEGATVALNATAVHAMFAGMSNLPDRTLQQAKTAIQNKINAGDTD